jgi:DNA-binding transcriptional ArsR family regulator
MLDRLFGSKTRVKLLKLFLNHPEKLYFIRELTRAVKGQINAIRRELDNLEAMGIIEVKKVKEPRRGKGRGMQKKYYKVKEDFLLFPELRALITKAQLLIEDNLVSKIKSLGTVYYLALTGAFVGEEIGTTDILLVGKIDPKKMKRLVKTFEKELGKEINYTVMGIQEFQYRREVADKFLGGILDGKKVVAIDKISNL